MITIGNKEFRNIQEQVEKNKQDIASIQSEAFVLDEFGIKVVGQVESIEDLPTAEEYESAHEDWAYGDAYAVGTTSPYELYILTRPNENHDTDYWFYIGEFPAPGPQGPAGEDGFSPEISISNIDGGHSVSITDADGTETFNVMDGYNGTNGQNGKSTIYYSGNLSTVIGDYTTITLPNANINDIVISTNGIIGVVTSTSDVVIVQTQTSIVGPRGEQGPTGPASTVPGPAGADGDDGFSPIVTITSITGGHQVSIEDATQTQTFDVMDGSDGANGQDGVTPSITAAATVDANVGTPSVVVTKTGTDAAPTFTFAFSNIKGEPGTTTIGIQVVASLPATGTEGIIYLVPSASASGDDNYDEYIYTNGNWELIGHTAVDLSNYIQKSSTSGLVKNDGTIDTNTYALASALNDYVTATSLSTTLNDYVLASALSTVATSGSYNDLTNKPNIPEIDNQTIIVDSVTGKIKTAIGGYDDSLSSSIPSLSASFTLDRVSGTSAFFDYSKSLETLTSIYNNLLSRYQNGYTIYADCIGITGVGTYSVAAMTTHSNPDFITLKFSSESSTPSFMIELGSTSSPDGYAFFQDNSSNPIIPAANSTIAITLSLPTIPLGGIHPIDGAYIPIDDSTIKLNNQGQLYAVGSGSGTITDVKVNNTSVVNNGVAEITLAAVATSGSYNDLINKPTIPSDMVVIEVSDQTDSGILSASDLSQITTDPTKTLLHRGTVYYNLTGLGTTNIRFTSSNGFTSGATWYTILVNKNNGNWSYEAKTQNYISTYVSDVQVDGSSVVNNGVASITMPTFTQVQSNWNQTDTTAADYIKNKPNLAAVATSGSYNDLSNKPTIPSDIEVITITGAAAGNLTSDQYAKLIAEPEKVLFTDGTWYYRLNKYTTSGNYIDYYYTTPLNESGNRIYNILVSADTVNETASWAAPTYVEYARKSAIPTDVTIITLSGTSGTLTAEQLALIQANPDKVIIKANGDAYNYYHVITDSLTIDYMYETLLLDCGAYSKCNRVSIYENTSNPGTYNYLFSTFNVLNYDYTNHTIAGDTFSGTTPIKYKTNSYNTYGANFPDTTNYTADKTLATTDQIATRYKHIIQLRDANNAAIATAVIENDSATAFTISTLAAWLYDNNYRTVSTGLYEASGAYNYNGTQIPAVGIRCYTSTPGNLDAVFQKGANSWESLVMTSIIDQVKVQSSTQVVLVPEMYYKNGDTYSNTNYYQAFGYITNGGKDIQFTLNFNKSLKNISSIGIDNLSFVARGVAGYVGGTSYIDYANTSSYTILYNISSENSITITVRGTSAWSNGANNTPVVIVFNQTPESLKLTFSG